MAKKKKRKTGPAPKPVEERSVKLSITVPPEVAEAAEEWADEHGSVSGFFANLYNKRMARGRVQHAR